MVRIKIVLCYLLVKQSPEDRQRNEEDHHFQQILNILNEGRLKRPNDLHHTRIVRGNQNAFSTLI